MKIKVALVLYTQGLDYDDRVRKEILSIIEINPNITFKIFAVEPKNREEEGVTSYGIPYRIPYLKTREKYPSATHKIAKTWDFYKTIKKDLDCFDIVWCADPETFLYVLLLKGKPIVWDLHELPEQFMGNSIKRCLFRLGEKKVTAMIHANQARLDYLIEKNLVKSLKKQFVLRNYPQFNEIDLEYDDEYYRFTKWLGEDRCVYLQGLMFESRADLESLKAVLSFSGLKAVVVGNIQPRRMEVFQEEFGRELGKRVFFTGQIKQLKTPQYIRKCFMSLVFYKNTAANNWLCEPNRLFQNLNNGVPVVVGNNPSLKDIVEKYNVGVCANTDGSDVVEIQTAMKKLIKDYDLFKKNTDLYHDEWLWQSQEGVIKQILDMIV